MLLWSHNWDRSLASRPSISTRPDVGSKKRQTRFTSVDFPAPVSPTIATLVPCGMCRLKCSSTYSSPSGYLKDTSSNVMSPCSGSQFSRFGSKESPYNASTSFESHTSDWVSISVEKRSTFTCTVIRSEIERTIHWIGSIIPSA